MADSLAFRMPPLQLLLVGPTERAEFRTVRQQVDSLAQVTAVDNLAQALERLEQDTAPDLIVLAQSYPGQFSARGVDSLRRLAPLARIVGLLGSWCEGEARSGEPWPGVVRVYWHQWEPRSHLQIAALGAGRGAAWALPFTASEEERLMALPRRPVAGAGLIVVSSREYGMAQWLLCALGDHGYSAFWHDSSRAPLLTGVVAGIFDADDARDREQAELTAFCAALPAVPIVALLTFPRSEDVARVRAAGVAAVVSKPLLLDDLFYWLDPLAAAHGAGKSCVS